jgi:hypothetical protein
MRAQSCAEAVGSSVRWLLTMSHIIFGNLFAAVSYLSVWWRSEARDLTFRVQQKEEGIVVMDAKYNYIIDSMKWRIVLNLTGFGLWLAASMVLLRLA